MSWASTTRLASGGGAAVLPPRLHAPTVTAATAPNAASRPRERRVWRTSMAPGDVTDAPSAPYRGRGGHRLAGQPSGAQGDGRLDHRGRRPTGRVRGSQRLARGGDV